MFAESLDQHPMDTLLAESPSLSFPRAGDRAFWERLPDDLTQSLRVLIDSYAARPYPMRTASGFLSFVRSGSRKADEDPYFLRRRKLCRDPVKSAADATRRRREPSQQGRGGEGECHKEAPVQPTIPHTRRVAR